MSTKPAQSKTPKRNTDYNKGYLSTGDARPVHGVDKKTNKLQTPKNKTQSTALPKKPNKY